MASSSQAVLLPLCRATVAGPGGRGWMKRRGGMGRKGGRSGMMGERRVRVAKLEVESKVDIINSSREAARKFSLDLTFMLED